MTAWLTDKPKWFRRNLFPSTSLLKLRQSLKIHELFQVCLNECYLANSEQRKKPPHSKHSEKRLKIFRWAKHNEKFEKLELLNDKLLIEIEVL